MLDQIPSSLEKFYPLSENDFDEWEASVAPLPLQTLSLFIIAIARKLSKLYFQEDFFVFSDFVQLEDVKPGTFFQTWSCDLKCQQRTLPKYYLVSIYPHSNFYEKKCISVTYEKNVNTSRSFAFLGTNYFILFLISTSFTSLNYYPSQPIFSSI